MIVGDDGSERFGQVWDFRADPEGLYFHKEDFESEIFEKNRKESESDRGRMGEAFRCQIVEAWVCGPR